MDEESTIDKVALYNFLEHLRTHQHAFYALITGLPEENLHICQYYDSNRKMEVWFEEPENGEFTISEFVRRYESFNPQDEFGICFKACLDKIDADKALEYEEAIHFDKTKDLTEQELKETIELFLETYCEIKIRQNRPFEFDKKTIQKFGFSKNDVLQLRETVEKHNMAARKKITAEYEALRKLDFLKE